MKTLVCLLSLLLASPASAASVMLTWVDTSVPANQATSFVVCRQTGTGAWTDIATPPASPYTDADVSAGTTYTYKIKAKNAAGTVSPASSTVPATIPAPVPPLTAPASPTATVMP